MRQRPKKRPDFDTAKGRDEHQACLRKAQFESERVALKTAAAPSGFVAPGVVLRAYKCRYCKKWHLTKQVPRGAERAGLLREHQPDADAFDVIDETTK